MSDRNGRVPEGDGGDCALVALVLAYGLRSVAAPKSQHSVRRAREQMLRVGRECTVPDPLLVFASRLEHCRLREVRRPPQTRRLIR